MLPAARSVSEKQEVLSFLHVRLRLWTDRLNLTGYIIATLGRAGVVAAGYLGSGFVSGAAVQPTSCINMMHIMYLWIPFVISLIITIILSEMNVEKAVAALKGQRTN